MTKSPRKNVPDVGIELGAACMPSELASDRATAPGDSIWNLASIGPVVSEEKMFKECGRRMTEAYLSYKLTNEPSAQVS